MILGYARVSTDDQNLDAQTDALKAAGAKRIFADKISGGTRKRPELGKLFEQLREGDVVVVAKYDRLARSLRDLLDIVEAIKERGAGFRASASPSPARRRTDLSSRTCSPPSQPAPRDQRGQNAADRTRSQKPQPP